MTDNFQGSRAQRLIDEFDEGETVADGIARVLKHLMYAFDVVYDGEYDSMIGVPVSTLDDLAVELRNAPNPEPEDPTDEELWELYDEMGGAPEDAPWVRKYARAVLARWGNHPESPDSSTQPIPVSERLPRPEDCDEEGRCWGFHQYNPEDDDIWESWYLVPTQHLLPSVQWLGFSHWLPANALPQPS